MTLEKVKEVIQKALTRPLPGVSAQTKMAPVGRITSDYDPEPSGARKSAVLILLHETKEGVAFPVIRRVDDGSTHAGQIALPGGGQEEYEQFPVDTALRESQEEISAEPSSVEVLGVLTPLYIPVSNFTVVPVVGVTRHVLHLTPDPSEVAEICTVLVDSLAAARTVRTFHTYRGAVDAPCFVTGEVVIWGATAMIISEFLAILSGR